MRTTPRSNKSFHNNLFLFRCSKDNTSYTLRQLLRMFIQKGFIIYVVVLVFLILNIYRWYLKCTEIEKEFGRSHEKYKPWKKVSPPAAAAAAADADATCKAAI